MVFGPFRLDVARHRLTRAGSVVAMGERAFGVLVELATHAGEVLSKDTLIERVWPDVGVSDEALAQAVHELRRALDDNPRAPAYVQTVHGRGYRFVAPVTEETLPEASPEGWVRRRWRVAAVGAAAACLVGLASWLVWRGTLREAVAQRVEEFLRLPGGAFKPAYSPDGRFLAVVSTDEHGLHALYLARPGLPTALRLTRDVDVRGPSPTFSADGNWIFFTTYRYDAAGQLVPEVQRVSVLGGRPEVVMERASAAHQDPTGTRLVVARVEAGGTAIVVREADGKERHLAERGFWPRWSPDGQWIAYTTADPEGGAGDLFLVRPDGSEHRQLTRGPWPFYGLDWTPDGEALVFAAARDGPFQLWWVLRDGGAPVRLTVGAGEDSCPAVAPDGSRVLFVNGRLRAGVLIAQGGEGPFRRLRSERPVLSLSWAGDGTHLAIVHEGGAGPGDLAVVELPHERSQPVAGLVAHRARWLADERALVVAGALTRSGPRGIYRVDWPRGSLTPWVRECACDWPDAHHGTLVYVRAETDEYALVVHDLASGQERVLLRRSELVAPRLSPDGRLVAWSGVLRPTDDSSTGIWVAPTDGSGTARRLAPDGAWPAWDGPDRLVFLRGATGDTLWRVALDGTPPTLVRSMDAGFPAIAFDAEPGGALAVAVHLDTPAIFAFEGFKLRR